MTVTPDAGPGTSAPYCAAIPYPSIGVNYETFNCPVATIAATSSSNAYYYTPTGNYSGPSYSTSTTMQLCAEADCVIAAGASLNFHTLVHGRLFPKATYIHLDEKPSVVMGNGRAATTNGLCLSH